MRLGKELERVSEQIGKSSRSQAGCTMFRVAPHVRKLKKEVYDCQLLSFGLYNRNIDDVAEDNLKVQVVAASLLDFKSNWNSVCAAVADPVGEEALSKLYMDVDVPVEARGRRQPASAREIRSELTFDAVFLTIFMSYKQDPEGTGLSKTLEQTWKILSQAKFCSILDVIFSDIWLFENQIPLQLIRNVWCNMLGQKDEAFDTYVRSTVFSAIQYYALPHDRTLEDTHEPLSGISFGNCNHMLECLYKSVTFTRHGLDPRHGGDDLEMGSTSETTPSPLANGSSANQLQPGATHSTGSKIFANACTGLIGLVTRIPSWWKENPTTEDTRRRKTGSRLVSAAELLKAGIKVRGTRTSFHEVKFAIPYHKLSAILHIPRINVSDNTDRILRNLCAFERVHSCEPNKPQDHPIMSYVSMMDHLLDTMDDVRLLREGKEPVIALNFLGSEKDVADLFNNILSNYHFASSHELEETFQEVHQWYSCGFRHTLTLLIVEITDRPWTVAAGFVVILAFLQTVYTMVGFHKRSS